jgi:hypothetical protein
MPEKIILEDFTYFGGKHCQTAAFRNLLAYHDIHLTEEMLFGLGGGIGFVYWYSKNMAVPFIGTRNRKVDDFQLAMCRRIGVRVEIVQTSSARKAYDQMKGLLRDHKPALVFVDMPYLSYLAMPEAAHFGGHAVVVYGVDEDKDEVYISDRAAVGVTASLGELEKARSSKFPPFPARNKLLMLDLPRSVSDPGKGIREAIVDCCSNMLNPPIRSLGLRGIQKWADLVPRWQEQFKGSRLLGCLVNTFMNIEVAGTGGGAMRPMYVRFLRESAAVLNKPSLKEVAEMFEQTAKVWSEIALAAMPDSWPALKTSRELLAKKNLIFEMQSPGALAEMREINSLFNESTRRSLRDLGERDPAPLMANLQKKILECYEMEKSASEKLRKLVQ